MPLDISCTHAGYQRLRHAPEISGVGGECKFRRGNFSSVYQEISSPFVIELFRCWSMLENLFYYIGFIILLVERVSPRGGMNRGRKIEKFVIYSDFVVLNDSYLSTARGRMLVVSNE